MIEPRQEDIDRNNRSLTALYIQEEQNIVRFILSVSESLAYQHALVRHYKEQERESILEGRRHAIQTMQDL